VLALYRSAAQPAMAELGRHLERASQRPGLALLATENHMVGTDRQRRRAVRRAGARVETLDGTLRAVERIRESGTPAFGASHTGKTHRPGLGVPPIDNRYSPCRLRSAVRYQ
jgi:hypothetical protein